MNGASEGPPSETERNRGRVLAPAPLQFPAAATYFGLSHSWSGWKTPASLGLDQKGPGSKEIPRCQAALGHGVLWEDQLGLVIIFRWSI